MKKTMITTLFAAMAMAAGVAQAENFYFGVGVGQTKFNSANAVAGDKTKDTSYSLLGGYNLNENFGAEVSYSQLGRYTVVGGGSLDATATSFVGVARTEVAPNCEVFGKIGVASVSAKDNMIGSLTLGTTTTKTDVTYGLGAGYKFNESFGIRASWDRYKVQPTAAAQKATADSFMLTGVYSF